MSTLIVALTVVALTAVYLMVLIVTEGFTGGLQFIPLAACITVATTALTTVTYLFSPLLWVLAWIAALAAATPLAILKLARTYPRQRIENLLTERIATVLGKEEWNKRISITFAKDNTATKVIITIPPAMIPSDITPRLKAVVGETLSGGWQTSTKGTRITITRKTVKPEPKYLRNLKDVVLAPRAFTPMAAITEPLLGDDDAIRSFTVTWGTNIAAEIAIGNRRTSIEKQLRASLPAGNGSWSFNWDIPKRTCVITRSMFKRRIDHTLSVVTAQTQAEAAANYPDLAIGLGIDEFGQTVVWKLDSDGTPHGIIFGATGGGKSSAIATIITEAAAAGLCIIIADFKGDNEYNRFRTWPGVHLVAQDFYSCLRAIAYAEELMNLRRSGGAAPKGGPSPRVGILLIVDEVAAGMEAIKQLWPRLKADNPKMPKEPPTVTSYGNILRLGRSLRENVFNATQRATADFFPAEWKHNCPMRVQAGQCDGTTSQNFWDDFDIGQTIPAKTPGRSIMRGEEGFVQFQGFYTPNPTDRPLSADEEQIMAALRPSVSLYPRMLIEMPDAHKISTWQQIATAPIVPAESRPDLDPESEKFKPRQVYQVDTISQILDPNTMQLKELPVPRDLQTPDGHDATDDDQDAGESDEQVDEDSTEECGVDSDDSTAPEQPPSAPKRRRATRQETTPIRSIQGEALSKSDYRR
ncbi:cell division protein FtsK [Mycobacteroides abscessus subsp. bolletii]|uniref:FtsK/SpoIIIE domain-containing protein n=1 Tax=Mycobacteroides abscessus TaxID=36809 RepID=UPI0009A8BF77|nr:FtsK/SpoIIIE domain-containing protein [Mycobacteroides abscessus]SKZ02806.1 cell division protein FtsK [Mycobacteroides abscessus subsp. bolletii]